jgi:hypothetical protein
MYRKCTGIEPVKHLSEKVTNRWTSESMEGKKTSLFVEVERAQYARRRRIRLQTFNVNIDERAKMFSLLLLNLKRC